MYTQTRQIYLTNKDQILQIQQNTDIKTVAGFPSIIINTQHFDDYLSYINIYNIVNVNYNSQISTLTFYTQKMYKGKNKIKTNVKCLFFNESSIPLQPTNKAFSKNS